MVVRSMGALLGALLLLSTASVGAEDEPGLAAPAAAASADVMCSSLMMSSSGPRGARTEINASLRTSAALQQERTLNNEQRRNRFAHSSSRCCEAVPDEVEVLPEQLQPAAVDGGLFAEVGIEYDLREALAVPVEPDPHVAHLRAHHA
mmetsp:Transcript_24815/g.81168  ORF Transcript_24815/g.81168 Transcript_24815/m.81168 type:complete len:148 (+) Transcript_24815:2-445(+)